MAVAQLTQEIVSATAHQLKAARGANPSNRQVLSAIGYGSMTTLAKLMNVWRDESPALTESTAALPSGLLRELETLQRNTEKAAREDCMTELTNAHDSEQLLIQENEQLQAGIASLQDQLKAAQESATKAQAQLVQLQADNAEMKSTLEVERDNLGQLRVELAKVTSRLEESLPRLQQELCDCREELQRARKAQVVAEIEAAVAAERANGVEQRLRSH